MSNNAEKSMLVKFKEVLGETNSKLMVLKGRLVNIVRDAKRDSKDEYYYTADIKVMQNDSEGYNVAFDMFHLIFPVAVSMALTDAELLEMKNNEVISLVVPSCRIKTVPGKIPDEDGVLKDMKYNNCSFYVSDIMKIKDVEKREFSPSYSYNL